MQQKFESFFEIFIVDAGCLLFNSFYFVITVNSTFDTASFAVFL